MKLVSGQSKGYTAVCLHLLSNIWGFWDSSARKILKNADLDDRDGKEGVLKSGPRGSVLILPS